MQNTSAFRLYFCFALVLLRQQQVLDEHVERRTEGERDLAGHGLRVARWGQPSRLGLWIALGTVPAAGLARRNVGPRPTRDLGPYRAAAGPLLGGLLGNEQLQRSFTLAQHAQESAFRSDETLALWQGKAENVQVARDAFRLRLQKVSAALGADRA